VSRDKEPRGADVDSGTAEFQAAVGQVSEMLEALSDQLLEDLLVMIRALASEPLDERKYSRSWREIIAFLDADVPVHLGSFVSYAVAYPDNSSLREASSERIRTWIDRAHRVAGRGFAVARQAQYDGVLDWDAAKVRVVEVTEELATSKRISVRVDRIDGTQLYLEMPPDSAVRLLRNYARDLSDIMDPTLAREVEAEDIADLLASVQGLVGRVQEPRPGLATAEVKRREEIL
jgi:hypothetical protein